MEEIKSVITELKTQFQYFISQHFQHKFILVSYPILLNFGQDDPVFIRFPIFTTIFIACQQVYMRNSKAADVETYSISGVNHYPYKPNKSIAVMTACFAVGWRT